MRPFVLHSLGLLRADLLLPYIQEGRPSRTVDPTTKYSSLEHGQSAFPPPNPTVLNPIVPPKDRKGKGKQLPEDEDLASNVAEQTRFRDPDLASTVRTVEPTTKFPSLEHGRLAFPRPNPTVLNPIVPPKDRKGQGKQIPEDEEDWTPTNEVSSPQSEVDYCVRGLSRMKKMKNSSPNTHQSISKTTNAKTIIPNTPQANPLFEEGLNRNEGVQDTDLDSTVAEQTRVQDPDLASTVAEQTRTIAHLNVQLTKTNAKVDELEIKVRTLNVIVERLIGKSQSEESGSKSGGGRIAVSSEPQSPG